jgi:CO/xanthine dehydrogenase FAD-binding subunit
LLPKALEQAGLAENETVSLGEALHYSEAAPERALLTALLALDAEIKLTVDTEARVLPLTGFLSYRSRLPLAQFPLDAVRLPPLNAGGHYLVVRVEIDRFMAVRLDLHPGEKLAGHVRVVVSRPAQFPQRLMSVEHRLERQVLSESLIQEAVRAGYEALPEPLTPVEEAGLSRLLESVIE